MLGSLILIFNLSLAAASPGQFRFVWRGDGRAPSQISDWARTEIVSLSPDVQIKILRFQKPLRETLADFQKKEGAVACDCGLFVQIISRLRNEKNPSGILLSTEDNPSQYVACACDHDLAYLRPDDLAAFLSLQKTSFAGKGYWLLPIRDDRYLSILGEAPEEGTASEWREWAPRMLLSEFYEKSSCAKKLVPRSEAWAELEYVKLQFKAGVLDRWTITPIPQNLVPAAQRKALRELLKD